MCIHFTSYLFRSVIYNTRYVILNSSFGEFLVYCSNVDCICSACVIIMCILIKVEVDFVDNKVACC